MKQIIKISSAILLISTIGCKKFLEKEPDNRAKLNSPAKVSQLLASAYPQGNYQPMAEIASDNAGDRLSDYIGTQQFITLLNNLYFYQDDKQNGLQDNPSYYWASCYAAIAASNEALNAISEVSDPENYQAQKGEALVTRAYSHFMLVNFFSKFYDANTASSDPGIPYVTEPESVSIKKYDRKTVQYVYDMVEKDLLEGMPLIKDESYAVPKFHFTKAATNAFAARLYLYKKDYDKVIKYCQDAIPENTLLNNLRPWNTVYADLPLSGAAALPSTYSKATENANLLLAQTNTFWYTYLGFGRYGLTVSLGNKFNTASIVQSPHDFAWKNQFVRYKTGLNFYNKIGRQFFENVQGSGTGYDWQMVPLFAVEEVLFNLAEAYVYKGQTDKAISLLNLYLSTRIAQYKSGQDDISPVKLKNVYGTDMPQSLISAILDLRRAEFAHEGLRWFDVLRYKITVQHDQMDPTGQKVINSVTLDANNPHRIFQIPVTAASQSGLTLNPR